MSFSSDPGLLANDRVLYILYWSTLVMSLLSCVKWAHHLGRDRNPAHAGTLAVRIMFSAFYCAVMLGSFEASIAEKVILLLTSSLFFDEVVNWLGPVIWSGTTRWMNIITIWRRKHKWTKG